MDRFVKKIKLQPSEDNKNAEETTLVSATTTSPDPKRSTSFKDRLASTNPPDIEPSGSKAIQEGAADLELDSEEEEDSLKKKCKPKTLTNPRKRKFVPYWLEDPNFKDWLVKSEDPRSGKDRAYCKVCYTHIIPHKSDITRHMNSSKHILSAKSIKKITPIDKLLSQPESAKVKRAELKLAGLIAANNLPIRLMDSLSPMMGNLFPDSKIAQQISVKRTKTTDIIKNNLGKSFGKTLYQKLAAPGCFFSLIMDETTDKAAIKQCAFSVIFYNNEKREILCRFFDMVEMPSGSAEDLVKCLKNTFQQNGVPLDNLVGFSSDTTNVMFGENHSVVALMRKEFPHVVFVKCSCHLIHLVASKACLTLPRSVEDLLRNIGSHFSRSYGRQMALQEFQEFFEVEIMKILSPSTTRWLSLEACVTRVLGQFTALKAYFRQVVFDDPSRTTEEMLQTLENPFTVIYLEFMSYTLGLLNNFNKLFQSEHPLLHKLQSEVRSLLTTLCANYMQVGEIRGTDIFAIDHKDASKFLGDKEVYLGLTATESIQHLQSDSNVKQQDLDLFYKTCQRFYIEAVSQIKQRFSFDDPIFEIIQVLDPKIAQNFEIKSLKKVLQKLPILEQFVDPNDLEQEWRNHALLDHTKLGLGVDLYPEDYWKKIDDLTNPAGTPLYPNLTKVMQLLMVLPFSNVSVERLFSDLNNIKTFHRNKLKNSTIKNLMLSKEGIEGEGGSVNFEPTKDMLFPSKDQTL